MSSPASANNWKARSRNATGSRETRRAKRSTTGLAVRADRKRRQPPGRPGGWRLLRSALTASPVVDLFARLVSRDPVAFLDLAFQLFALAGDDIQIVVGEIAPLLLDLALDLLPVSLDSIPVHSSNSLFDLAGQAPNSQVETQTGDDCSRDDRREPPSPAALSSSLPLVGYTLRNTSSK